MLLILLLSVVCIFLSSQEYHIQYFEYKNKIYEIKLELFDIIGVKKKVIV